ncbi:MAG: AmmeMemoRadiSam system protein A [Bacilli bacterium]|nr:AmmeMemoRadiSam system protein A [Bacilli bacterium]
MPILSAYMVPHPPMIIPEVGRGGESQISLTIESYQAIAEEIASLEPDTIIISSPHAPFYKDHFYLSGDPVMRGDMGAFGADSVQFSEEIDTEFVQVLSSLTENSHLPVEVEKNISLDHGTMVPLHFIRKVYKKGKIVILGCSSLPLIDHYRVGECVQKAILQTNRRVVYIASGDLSHKLRTSGPYGFISSGPVYDKAVLTSCHSLHFEELLEYDDYFLEKVAECGHPSFTMMAGCLDCMALESKFYSHEGVTGVGYGICSFHLMGDDPTRNFGDQYLSKKREKVENDPYVMLAKEAVYQYVIDKKVDSLPSWIKDEMPGKAGVFVSIHEFHELRGCVGTFLPTTPVVWKEIIRNAIAACSEDNRFQPIQPEELPFLNITVDVLSPPKYIDRMEELDPKKYGIIVSSGPRRGLLLPDLEGIDDVDTQVKIAMRKGNIAPKDPITIQKFQVVRHY